MFDRLRSRAEPARSGQQALDLEVLNVAITLDKDKPNSVFQPGGTAVIIHAGKDDYTSDPAGNAGDRIICV
jgi:superoxide dismutase, Cu-Zn family